MKSLFVLHVLTLCLFIAAAEQRGDAAVLQCQNIFSSLPPFALVHLITPDNWRLVAQADREYGEFAFAKLPLAFDPSPVFDMQVLNEKKMQILLWVRALNRLAAYNNSVMGDFFSYGTQYDLPTLEQSIELRKLFDPESTASVESSFIINENSIGPNPIEDPDRVIELIQTQETPPKYEWFSIKADGVERNSGISFRLQKIYTKLDP